jgi:hypothetical protein
VWLNQEILYLVHRTTVDLRLSSERTIELLTTKSQNLHFVTLELLHMNDVKCEHHVVYISYLIQIMVTLTSMYKRYQIL